MFSHRTLLLFITSLISLEMAASPLPTDDILAVVRVTKNEEHTICATLQPFIDEGITTFFIYDHYSTDKTIEVAREFFIQNKIERFHMVQEPFIDYFSTSINRALDLTEESFPDCEFMFTFNEYGNHQLFISGLLAFCKENCTTKLNAQEQSTPPIYLMLNKHAYSTLKIYDIALIRARSNKRYVAKSIPEYMELTQEDRTMLPDSIHLLVF